MLLSKIIIKLLFIMGAGIVLSLPVPAINNNKIQKVVIKQGAYIYQVNKRRGEIEKIYIFNRNGDCKGIFNYDELEPKHRKVINEKLD